MLSVLLFNIFILIALFIMAWFFFVVWIIVMIARGFGRGIGKLLNLGGSRRTAMQYKCSRLRCAASNPAGANFCRRCGAKMENRAMRIGQSVAA